MPVLVMIALQIIQQNFSRDETDNPVGTAKLTAVSSAIGGIIHKHINRESIPWNMEVRLGDLFIEAFYNTGYIDIYYPKARDTSYIISATNKWLKLAELPVDIRVILKGTHLTKPRYIKKLAGAGNSEIKTDTEIAHVRAVNKLQQVGWRINQRVYKALKENKDLFASSTPVLNNEAKELRRRSKNLEWGFIMAKAKELYHADTFYQDVEVDYRGRVYYAEPFLNYQGSDLSRGMLKFSKGKPMTAEGMWWLAVHTACSFNQSYSKEELPSWAEADYFSYLSNEGLDSISVDKFTLEDRVRWTNENMDVILEAGRTHHIFTDAEKPVSFLAACIEWHDFSEAEKDGRIYMSHLPIPIDGSNNGWQHLGAMSKDKRTGKLVGLTPEEIQEDFYVKTAKELYSITTDERRKKLLEDMPMKHIRKGISKRGSMTRAYSAGATKIAENMWFDCRTEDYHELYGLEEKDCIGFAKDLVTAIDAVCPGPLDTMYYLQQLAAYMIGKYAKFKDGVEAGKEFAQLSQDIKTLYVKKDKTDEELEELSALIREATTYETRLIYGMGEQILTWTTPSGFTVNYEDWAMRSVRCRGTISGLKIGKTKTINHVARIATDKPDVRSFMCGISPNFVHSMDAAHMALIIDEWDNDFGAVHDSFAVHACDVDDLLDLTKKTFVDIYDVDNFFNYIRKEITNNNDDVKQPTLGDLDIQEVYYGDYFFS